MISDMEFAQLYDINQSKNPRIPHCKYNSFDLVTLTKDECKTNFCYCPKVSQMKFGGTIM